MADSKEVAAIIGIEAAGKSRENYTYRVMMCHVTRDDKEQTGMKWTFKPLRVGHAQLVQMAYKHQFINAEVTGNNICGKYASLDRFIGGNGKKPAEAVVISEIVVQSSGSTAEKVVGYRVAYASGKVARLKRRDLVEQAVKYNKTYQAPYIQNMKLVMADNTEPFLSKYSEDSIIKERIHLDIIKSDKEVAEEKQLEHEKHDETKLKFTDEQKMILTNGAKKGVNIDLIKHPSFSADAMKFYISELEAGMDIKPYLSPKYNIGQLMVLSEACESGVDLNKLRDPKLTAEQMQEVFERLDNQIWSIDYTGSVIGPEAINK